MPALQLDSHVVESIIGFGAMASTYIDFEGGRRRQEVPREFQRMRNTDETVMAGGRDGCERTQRTRRL